MKQFAISTAVLAITMCASAVAYWFGFREGAQVGLMIDYVPRGAISLHHISAIRSETTNNTIIALEGDIDSALLWAYRLDQHPLKPLPEPIWGFPFYDSSQYLSRLADYRKTHPSPLRAEALAMEVPPLTAEQAEFRKQLIDGAKEHDAIIASMIQQYATDPAK